MAWSENSRAVRVSKCMRKVEGGTSTPQTVKISLVQSQYTMASVSPPPMVGTATRRNVGSGSVNIRAGKPPWRLRASGSTQQKVQKRVVMEKNKSRTSTMRNHSPSHEELTNARTGMATASVVVAQRLRDQISQAMAAVEEFMWIGPRERGTPTRGWMRRNVVGRRKRQSTGALQ